MKQTHTNESRRLLLFIPRIPGSRRLWLTLTAALFLAFGFFEIVDDLFLDPAEGDVETHQFDLDVMARFAAHRTPFLTRVMTDLTAMGSVSVITVLLIITCALLYALRDRLGILHVLIASAGAALWPETLKHVFGRERPDVDGRLVSAEGLSFPSGHSFGSAAVYLTLAFLASRHLRGRRHEVFAHALAVSVIAVIGLSRVYLGVHYPSDVLGGICAGSAWSFLVTTLLLRSYAARTPRRELPPGTTAST